ncbi:hypothetical protein H632_c2664p1, partial [Helicosporidium sp. ATCC 50920]
MSDDAVALLAAQLEKKAYDTATVQARTTTGHRPHDETLKGYLRKLSQLVIEAAEPAPEALSSAAPEVEAAADVLDLRGEREFVSVERARELFGGVLARPATLAALTLSTKSFSPASASVAAEAISHARETLKRADLSDVIA